MLSETKTAPKTTADAMTHFLGDNATFYYFKDTGKYYAHSRGKCPEGVWEPYLGDQLTTRKKIVDANDGAMPGLSGKGTEFRIFIVLDENVDFGWPITLKPEHLAA